MTWTELRPILQKQFGNNIGYYNDLRKSYRRIKIHPKGPNVRVKDILDFIKSVDSTLDAGEYVYTEGNWRCISAVVKFVI
jgi:hypothetical protein